MKSSQSKIQCICLSDVIDLRRHMPLSYSYVTLSKSYNLCQQQMLHPLPNMYSLLHPLFNIHSGVFKTLNLHSSCGFLYCCVSGSGGVRLLSYCLHSSRVRALSRYNSCHHV